MMSTRKTKSVVRFPSCIQNKTLTTQNYKKNYPFVKLTVIQKIVESMSGCLLIAKSTNEMP